jgi:hypothetical protein
MPFLERSRAIARFEYLYVQRHEVREGFVQQAERGIGLQDEQHFQHPPLAAG